MPSIFRRIDDFMFDRVFQPLVDRFPDQGPVGVARFFIMGVVCADVMKFLVSTDKDAFDHYVVPALSIAILSLLYWRVSIYGKPGLRNPQRIAPTSCVLRMLCVLILPLDLVDARDMLPRHVYHALDSISFLAYLYVSACDVRPPSTRKAPFWQSWFRTAPQGA